MKRFLIILKWLAISFGAVVLLVAALAVWQRQTIAQIARNWDAFTEGAEIASALKEPEDVLDFIAAHRGKVSLAIWTVGEEEAGFFLDADTPRTLASTVKILVLAAYADQVEAGNLDPSTQVHLSDWEAYWLPGTDGGAHDAALKDLRKQDRLVDGQVTLHDVARAMIQFSDNAATDLLLERIGREAMERFVEQLDLPGQEAPFPLAGTFLSWGLTGIEEPAAERLERYRSMERAAYVDEAWRLAHQMRSDEIFREAELRRLKKQGIAITMREQAAFAHALGNQGTVRGYARIMEQVASGSLRGSGILREHLEWPMADESIRADFETYGAKGGSLAGILTRAVYARPAGGGPQQVMALFYSELPGSVWFRLMTNPVQKQFERRLLQDEAFREQVRTRLSAPAPATAAEG